jgi:tRNA 2-selenouridine synthase SelU
LTISFLHRGLSSGLLKFKKKIKNLILIKIHLWKPERKQCRQISVVFLPFEKHTLRSRRSYINTKNESHFEFQIPTQFSTYSYNLNHQVNASS